MASAIGEAFTRGAATRIERTVAGGGKGGGGIANLEQTLTVSGSAVATFYWNRSRPSPGAWQAGEIFLGLAVAAGTPDNSLKRVATGVVTGAILGLLAK